jgi:hypothetical protein
VAGPPHFWPRGGFGHPHTAVWGWPKPPQAFGGGSATSKGHQEQQQKSGKMGLSYWGWFGHPQNPKPIARSFLFFLAFRGGWTTPKSHPHTASMGWPATPWPKMGWSGHPIFWARSHPDFFPPPPQILFYNFFLFLNPKKKSLNAQNYVVLGKTTSFWTSPKRCSFGVNGSLDNCPKRCSFGANDSLDNLPLKGS